jgi:hypothetical protein
MKHIIVIVLFALTAVLARESVSTAQPQQCTEQVASLQKAITAIQSQRDRASNEQVNMAVQIGMMQDELAKLKAENEELKKKDEPPK